MVLEVGAALAVLAAGALHATWNAMVKSGGDQAAMLAVVMAAGGLPALPLLFVLPPPAAASWPYLAASLVIHIGYFTFLLGGYRHGDLSQVYPIARGAAPALVAAGAWLAAGEALDPIEAAGVAIVSGGIVSLAWRRGGLFAGAAAHGEAGAAARGEAKAVGFALLTAATIAAYLVADGLGVRRAGLAYSYIAWLFVLQAPTLLAAVLWLRRGRLRAAFAPVLGPGALGGLVAFASYGTAIWAMSLGPLAHVVALRETGVLVAAVIGTRLMGEPFGPRRVAAAAAVAAGAVLLQTGGAA